MSFKQGRWAYPPRGVSATAAVSANYSINSTFVVIIVLLIKMDGCFGLRQGPLSILLLFSTTYSSKVYKTNLLHKVTNLLHKQCNKLHKHKKTLTIIKNIAPVILTIFKNH